MDLNGLIRLIFLEKNDVTFGVLIGLTLLVVVLMLVRSVMEEKGSVAADGIAIDPKSINVAIEGALKKALSDKSVASVADVKPAGDGAAAEGSADTVELKKTLNEREAKIAALMSDLEAMKSAIEAKPAAAAAGGGGGNDAELQKKVAELQAKLSEYEIIEDDIADLSIYKEENKKLKDEVEKLRAGTQTAQIQVQAAQAAVAAPAAQPAADPVQAAQAAIVEAAPSEAATSPAADPTPSAPAAAPAPVSAKGPAPEPFKLDASDDVMGEFAKALSGVGSESATETNLITSKVDAAVVDPQAAIDALLNAGEAKTPVVSEPAETKSGESTIANDFANAVAGIEGVAPTVAAASSSEPVPEAAVASTDADPFGPVDTDKMLEEVASMKESPGDSASVLEEQLDTDRLMAEMGLSGGESANPAEGATAKSAYRTEESPVTGEFAVAVATAPPESAASAASAPTPAPSSPMVTSTGTPNDAPVDDLLAEFKDNDFQANKGAKGS